MPQGPLLRDLLLYPIERYIPPVAKVDDLAESTAAAETGEIMVSVFRLLSEGYGGS